MLRLMSGLTDWRMSSKLGVKKGDRIGMLQVNCVQFVEAYFAAAKMGAIFVPLNFRAKADELTYMILNAEAKVLFVGERYLDMVNGMLPQLACVEHCICLDGGFGRQVWIRRSRRHLHQPMNS